MDFRRLTKMNERKSVINHRWNFCLANSGGCACASRYPRVEWERRLPRYELRRKKSIVGMSTGFALDLRTVRLHNSPFPRRNLYDSAVEQTTFPPRQEWAVHVWKSSLSFFFEKNWNAKWTKNHISTRIDGIRTPKFVTIVSSRCKELYSWFWFEVLFCGEGRCTFHRHRRSDRRITKIIHHGKRWPNFKISFHGYCHKR